MKDLQIYINGIAADLNEVIKPTLDKIVSEYRNPVKKVGSFSYTLTLPLTQVNRKLFGFQDNLQVIGKFRTLYQCVVTLDSVEVLVGEFVLNKITSNGFHGFVAGSGEQRVADLFPEKATLRDITGYTLIDFDGDRTVWDYLDRDLNATNSDVAFPFVFDSFARLRYLNGGTIGSETYRLSYEDFGLSHFTANIFKNIFKDAGYELDGEILSDETFNKMVMLYSNEEQESPKYNYARLNPFTAFTYWQNNGFDEVGSGEDFDLFCTSPYFGFYRDANSGLEYGVKGDLSFSQRDFFYDCKCTGLYDISYQMNVVNSRATYLKFVVFRDITDEQYTVADYGMQTHSNFNLENIKDRYTLSVGQKIDVVGRTDSLYVDTFSARLVEGRRYQVQVYMTASKEVENFSKQRLINDVNHRSFFNITKVEAKEKINPADFLPKMPQVSFVQAIFKLFSLFYTADIYEKKITVYTRDQFYALNRENILDLTDKLNLGDFEETPLSTAEIAETYYRYATDESDHLLNYTDYMSHVNGDTPEEAYELPFAPLGFIRTPIVRYTEGEPNGESFELVPCAIPATDTVDTNILEDFTAQSKFAYKPKIALYQGNGYLVSGMTTTSDTYYAGHPDAAKNNTLLLNFYRTFPITGGTYIELFGTVPFKPMPKLTFFNVREQPAYDLEILPETREFRLALSSGSTIYTDNDTQFLNGTEMVNQMDRVSLGLAGSKSLFQELYRNDLSVTDWSSFSEGTVKMSPLLFQQLNGRNLLKIEDDLYLLNSITNYSLMEDTAKVKIYKMVNG